MLLNESITNQNKLNEELEEILNFEKSEREKLRKLQISKMDLELEQNNEMVKLKE